MVFNGATGRNKSHATTNFIELKETLDKKLQDEIEVLIKQNAERETNLREVNKQIMEQNQALQ